MKHIGKNIKKHRTAMGMTQDQLAEKLNVTRQAVSNWETGKTQPSIETLTALAAHFDISAEMLIYGKSRPFLENNLRTGTTFGGLVLFFMLMGILFGGIILNNIWWMIITVSLVLSALFTMLVQQEERLDTMAARIELLEEKSTHRSP